MRGGDDNVTSRDALRVRGHISVQRRDVEAQQGVRVDSILALGGARGTQQGTKQTRHTSWDLCRKQTKLLNTKLGET